MVSEALDVVFRPETGRVASAIAVRYSWGEMQHIPRAPQVIPDVDTDQAAFYAEMVAGVHAEGPRGRVLFCVSTDDLDEGKGDPYVALGLGRYLIDEGWGVSLWPMNRWHEAPVPEPTVAIVMLDSFIPGKLPAATATIAWIRNWTDTWAELPYLDEFDGLWCSSPESARALRERVSFPVAVVPIGVDLELFSPRRDDEPRTLPVVTTANFWGAERQVQSALTALASATEVTWFGANRDHLARSASINHADKVSFFGMPSVYAQSKIVVDDLIEPARGYGTHNSRLFESIACGAVPVTNSANGLADLGLEEVPTYTDDASLQRVVTQLLADDGARVELAQRLRAVVMEGHSFRTRAAFVAPLIDDAILKARDRRRRPAMLAWATEERSKLQSAERLRDGHLITVRRLERELEVVERALGNLRKSEAELSTSLRALEASRLHRIAEKISRAVARVRASRPVPR